MSNDRFELFPAIAPLRQGLLELDHGHQMHWQVSGNPNGEPVVWIHGGPGSSSSAMHRRFFEPDRFQVIQYDQRGCGQSEPKGSIQSNTTQDLIADLERLRKALGVTRWSVVAGSWGATLALLYGQARPEVIERMVLRSPFLGTTTEIERYFFSPPPACRPQWERLSLVCRELGSEDIQACSYRVFCQEDDGVSQAKLARAWTTYEAAMDAYPVPVIPTTPSTAAPTRRDDAALIARYKIQMHYLQHQCFLDQPVLDHVHRLRGLDLRLVHGEQDALCPFDNSLLIQSAITGTELVPVAGAGHNMFDARMLRALFTQIQRWA